VKTLSFHRAIHFTQELSAPERAAVEVHCAAAAVASPLLRFAAPEPATLFPLHNQASANGEEVAEAQALQDHADKGPLDPRARHGMETINHRFGGTGGVGA
jgi:hypothetical protein